MAKRFTDLTELTTPASDDVLAIVDTSANETKRITLLGLLTNFIDAVHIKANAIITSKLNNGAVTTAKFKPSIIDFRRTASTNFSTTSTTFVDVTNGSFTYTSGATPERLLLWYTAMLIQDTGGGGHSTLNIGGVDQYPDLYVEPNSRWQTQTRTYVYDVPANTVLTIKMRARQGGGTVTIHGDNNNWLASVRGFSIYNGA